MDYTQLPNSDLIVSKVCMGTMTFGQQNTVDQGVQKLQHAHHEYGINFVDTAEMYPVPTKPETQGLTDQAVSGFLKTVPRQDIVLATKVAGRSDRITWMPRASGSGSEGSALTPTQIKESVDASLQRLGVDYIDLLQLHWPGK
jgi:aryl-alcohol dehydrogenase-like predicted oxidoreductase